MTSAFIDTAQTIFRLGGGITRSDIVREVACIPDDEVIMTCVAMGYPDDSFPANGVRSDRQSNGEFVRFVGFAE